MNGTKITIGRDPRNDIKIEEKWDTVSNNHCTISLINGQLSFTDHSTNGTVINEQKIQNITVGIYRGDIIRLANVYDLDWDDIESFFPELSRPTVTRNVRAESQNPGRHTQPINLSGQGITRIGNSEERKGRATEKFDQHQQTPNIDNNNSKKRNFGIANEYSQSEMDGHLEKWNWGAFFCSWLWGAFNGVLWPLFIIAIAGIPYLGQTASLCLCVYLGLNGSKLAWRSGKYKNFDQFLKIQRIWAIIGIIWFTLTIVGNIFLLKYTLSLF